MLQCTTEYPCPPEQVGLNVMLEMKERYGLPVGLSDHTLSNAAALAAVTLGASVVEKHLTLSKRMYGSDARHSAEPPQFKDLVSQIREVKAMMSRKVDKATAARFTEMKDIFQKSVVTKVDIPQGAVITREMIGVKKPGTGIPPKRFEEVVGSRALAPPIRGYDAHRNRCGCQVSATRGEARASLKADSSQLPGRGYRNHRALAVGGIGTSGFKH